MTVLLYVKPGQFEGFREYESKAVEIMRDYGGKLEKAIAPASINSSTLSLPDEIH